MFFIETDINESKRVSQLEVTNSEKTNKDFKTADINPQDFQLSKDELIAAPETQNQLLQKDIDVGFPLVDKNDNGYISKIENNKAQMIAYKFNKLDTDKNGLISELELNINFPYTEVRTFMDKFSDSKNKPYPINSDKTLNPTMNLFDFELFYYYKSTDQQKCTELEIHDTDHHKDLTKCSVGGDCYDETLGKYDNKNCAEPNESCGAVTYWDESESADKEVH